MPKHGMDLHRLRVVEFDTSVSKKGGEKKYIVENVEYKQEAWNISINENKDETGDENQCLGDNNSPPGLSKKSVVDKIRPSGISKKYLDDNSNPPGTSKKCADDKIWPPDRTSDNYLNDITSTSPPGISQKDNFARSKSKSEIFKIPPKNKPRKPELKINSSGIGFTKVFLDSAYLHQKERPFNLRSRNSRVHHKVENIRENIEKDEEVHFLSARKTPSFIKYCRKRAKNERTTAKKKRCFELPNDIYGFQKSNRSINQYQYRMSCFNFIDTNKIPFKKLRRVLQRKPTPPEPVVATKCACKHHAMRLLNSASEIDKSPLIYYNVGIHPRRSQRKRDYDQEEGFGRECSHCMARDETVEVSPSSLDPVSISCRNAGIGPSKVELSAVCRRCLPCFREESPAHDNVTIKRSECKQEPTPQPCRCLACAPKPGAAPAQNKCKKKRNKMKKTKFSSNVPAGFISRCARHITDFHTKKKVTGENCMKYVFLALLIVVWSPCLLAIILAWVVLLPVKLKSILNSDKSKRSCPMNHSLMNRFRKKYSRCEYQRMCSENYLPKNKRSFMTSATSWYSRIVSTIVNTLTSLFKLKKQAPTGAGSLFLPSSHPNPRKKYTLFYADNRGWVMKTLRRRNTRSSASTRVLQSVRHEVRPKLRCLKNRARKLKKSCPCPVQGDDSYPRHKLSAAGDTCRWQCTGPWPGCVCWDKYSQGSPMFTRLESHHHRRKQHYSPGLGRTSQGAVQQQYPDFNRAVSIRYPGYNLPRKRSEPIPGLSSQPPTNNYPPAPIATSPPQYARGPCYTNLANRCGPKSPYDESALRRAYKRRPSRYTPPRQQLPRVVMEKKLKENIKKAAAAKKRKAKRSRNKTCFQCLRDLINQSDREAWPTDLNCHPMWLNALKQRTCFWIYKTCPRMYPAFLNFYKYQQNISQMFVYLLTLCFWSPLILCGYFCCDMM